MTLILFCAQELSDGHVEAVFIPRLLLAAGAKPKHLDELVANGLVDKLGNVPGSPMADDYYLPDYLEWNPSREDLERQLQASREKQRAYREKKRLEQNLGTR